jgi:predicted TIM-barrel fold metal-dependent hydrolase
MMMQAQYTRRYFLKGALASSAACHLARCNAAAETATPAAIGQLIDTHVYIDHWPHAHLLTDGLGALLATLRMNNVAQAWIGSFDGLFHKDIAAVNHRLADACAQQNGDILVPFGTVNLSLPDWEDDVRRCHESFHMRGIRLHPNYHGYTLDDPRFARLLDLAAGRGLIVQLVASLDDARHKWLTPNVTHVDLTPLAKVVATLPKVKLVIARAARSAVDEAIRSFAPLQRVYFDFARIGDADSLAKLVDRLSVNKLVFGSGAPLHSIDSMRSKLQYANLPIADRNEIAAETAARMIGDRAQSN